MSSDKFSSFWSPEVAQAIAHNRSMPGVEQLQQQFVRYDGQFQAQNTEQGWTRGRSEAAFARRAAATSGMPPPCPAATQPPHMPEQVQLKVTCAPAEFCLPMKADRRFKPHFKVQVRVKHSGTLLLPLRLKAFAIRQKDKDSVPDWLPPELPQQVDTEARASRQDCPVYYKGPSVLSHIFRTSQEDSPFPPPLFPALFQHSAFTPAAEKPPTFSQGLRAPAPSAPARPAPMFPSRSVRKPRPLQEPDCMNARGDDPDLATELPDESAEGVIAAEYEFCNLEFKGPSRMRPVYMVFACMVANQDLLFVVYEVPCIVVARAEQRLPAAKRLGMPPTALAEVAAAKQEPAHSLRLLSAADTFTTSAAMEVDAVGCAKAEVQCVREPIENGKRCREEEICVKEGEEAWVGSGGDEDMRMDGVEESTVNAALGLGPAGGAGVGGDVATAGNYMENDILSVWESLQQRSQVAQDARAPPATSTSHANGFTPSGHMNEARHLLRRPTMTDSSLSRWLSSFARETASGPQLSDILRGGLKDAFGNSFPGFDSMDAHPFGQTNLSTLHMSST